MKLIIWLSIFLLFNRSYASDIRITPQDLEIEVGEAKIIQVIFDPLTNNVTVHLNEEHGKILIVNPNNFEIPKDTPYTQNVELKSINPGHETIRVAVEPNIANTEEGFIRVVSMISYSIKVTSTVLGWLYFVAWSISFYPQMYTNWKRKSVIGLNFDFVVLNIVGFVLYSLFNVGLYWIPGIQETYYERYPTGVIPVLLNDVVFSLHAVFATVVTLIQCIIYERGDQKVSWTARIIMGVFALFLFISAILSGTDVLTWLDFLYFCSYVKLAITLIKYIPQAYMNYIRKSTIGWSIGNIFLDFTGGALSMLQMMLNAHNYDDWASFLGDPTKFGLGLFSILFDILFIFQHYVLYRHPYEPIEGRNIATSSSTNNEDEPIYS